MSNEDLTSDENLYYMQVRGHSGNSLLWWRKGRHGYTCDIQQAEIFTEEEAKAQRKSRPTEDFPWRKQYIDACLEHHVSSEMANPEIGRMKW